MVKLTNKQKGLALISYAIIFILLGLIKLYNLNPIEFTDVALSFLYLIMIISVFLALITGFILLISKD